MRWLVLVALVGCGGGDDSAASQPFTVQCICLKPENCYTAAAQACPGGFEVKADVVPAECNALTMRAMTIQCR